MAGTTAYIVPGAGLLVGSAINGAVWLYEHGEKDYFIGTTFVVKEKPKVKEGKGKNILWSRRVAVILRVRQVPLAPITEAVN